MKFSFDKKGNSIIFTLLLSRFVPKMERLELKDRKLSFQYLLKKLGIPAKTKNPLKCAIEKFKFQIFCLQIDALKINCETR